MTDFGVMNLYAAQQQALANAQWHGQLYGLGVIGAHGGLSQGARYYANQVYNFGMDHMSTIEKMEYDVKSLLRNWDA